MPPALLKGAKAPSASATFSMLWTKLCTQACLLYTACFHTESYVCYFLWGLSLPFRLCWGNEAAARGYQTVIYAELAKKLHYWWCNDGGVRGTMQSNLEDRKGVVDPTVIKHTHAHAHTQSYCNHNVLKHTCFFIHSSVLTCIGSFLSYSIFSHSKNTVVYCAA